MTWLRSKPTTDSRSMRTVQLRATADVVTGYGAVGQAKWAAWRRKEGLQEVSEPDLDEQLSRVAQIVDPLFLRQD